MGTLTFYIAGLKSSLTHFLYPHFCEIYGQTMGFSILTNSNNKTRTLTINSCHCQLFLFTDNSQLLHKLIAYAILTTK